MLAVAVIIGVSPCVHAQAAANREPLGPAPDPCRAEISKFEQAIGFVRQHQGNEAAAQLKEKLLPAKVERDLLFSEGYCGLAKYLREKKLVQ
jgi:hypothetical protein